MANGNPKTITVYCTAEDREFYQQWADRENRTLSNFFVNAVKEHIGRQEAIGSPA